MALKRSFAPIIDHRTRILLLGSLPGEESLRQAQYYAHPQNRFWELVGDAINQPLRELGYEMRLSTLRAHHIGLWDVIAQASRKGSLDSAIRDESNNDLAEIIASLPDLKAIGFNGQKAAKTGRKQLLNSGLQLIDLPSSSPAYAAMSYKDKQSRWAVIGNIVRS